MEAAPLPIRIELFFKTTEELRTRVRDLRSRGVTAFNLVNKHKGDPLLEWAAAVRAEAPRASLCVHYSLRYNVVAARQGGADASFQRFVDFLRGVSARQLGAGPAEAEVLLVSGSGPRGPLDAVACLRRLAKGGAHCRGGVRLGVAFNPYWEAEADREEERARLRRKLETGAVSSVWLQFGADAGRLASACAWLASLGTLRPRRLVGSLFLPTRQLIAQQRYRPWNGVFLSEAYLSGPESAEAVTRELLDVYRRYGAEVLVEAPGVRTSKDLDLVMGLLGPGPRDGPAGGPAAAPALEQDEGAAEGAALRKRPAGKRALPAA